MPNIGINGRDLVPGIVVVVVAVFVVMVVAVIDVVAAVVLVVLVVVGGCFAVCGFLIVVSLLFVCLFC